MIDHIPFFLFSFSLTVAVGTTLMLPSVLTAQNPLAAAVVVSILTLSATFVGYFGRQVEELWLLK